MKPIKIGNKKIGRDHECYIIAEIGANFDGSLTKAKKLIRLAKDCGADAAKFQSYKAELIASTNSPYYWDIKSEKSRSQFRLFKKFDKFEKEIAEDRRTKSQAAQ